MSNINTFLQKSFASFGSSIILPLGMIAYELAKCAKSNTYVETFTKHADTLHLWVKKGYEDDFKKAFESVVRKTIKQLGVTYAHIAVDYTKEPFYGKSSSLYIINTKGEKWDAEFHFIVISLITRNKQIPLMALPVRVGEGIPRPTIELLDYCLNLFRGIRLAVFDREFYCAEIIDFLEAKKIKYLILMPEKGEVITDYIAKTDELGKFKHTMTYSKDKSKWHPKTTVVVCKGIDEYPWMFATNIHFKTRVEYIWYYKRRWQIETNFRVEDEGKIKSKSCSYLVRYFYFLFSLLLHLLWVGHKNLKYYVPYKKYLDIIEHKLLFDYLEIGHT
mgnify:FL=1